METADGEDILNGLSDLQKDQVSEWIHEFRLSLSELASWRRDREVFVKSVKYKVPVDTAVDLICRDIYELKLFGVRVADFFHRNGEPPFLKICGRVFTQEEAMRWVLVKSHLKTPFLFSKGEPQRILNLLASDTRKTHKRTHDASGSGSMSRDQRSDTLSIVSVVGGVGTGFQENYHTQPLAVEVEDRKPSQEELECASAEFARESLSNAKNLAEPIASPGTSRGTGMEGPAAHDGVELLTLKRSAPKAAVESRVLSAKPRGGRRGGTKVAMQGTGVPKADSQLVRSSAGSTLMQATNVGKASVLYPSSNTEPVRTIPTTAPRDPMQVSIVTQANANGFECAPVTTWATTRRAAPSVEIAMIENRSPMHSVASPSPAGAVFAANRLPEVQANTSVVLVPQSEPATQHPVRYLAPISCENVVSPGQHVYIQDVRPTPATCATQDVRPTPATCATQDVRPTRATCATQDDSSKAYQAMVEIYLKQFQVSFRDFSDWLINTHGCMVNLVPPGELFARADVLLTAIENVLAELETRPTPGAPAIAYSAKLLGVSKESVQRWMSPKIRALFHKDKTALKYELFQRVFPAPKDSTKTLLPQMEEIARHKPNPELVTFDHHRGRPIEYRVNLVKNVLDFYSLDTSILDELPIECNRGYRDILRRITSLDALQMLFTELGVLLSYRQEICMFSESFSVRDTAFCFEKPVASMPPAENMFHVSVDDALRAVTLEPRLRTGLFGKKDKNKKSSKKIRDLLEKYERNA